MDCLHFMTNLVLQSIHGQFGDGNTRSGSEPDAVKLIKAFRRSPGEGALVDTIHEKIRSAVRDFVTSTERGTLLDKSSFHRIAFVGNWLLLLLSLLLGEMGQNVRHGRYNGRSHIVRLGKCGKMYDKLARTNRGRPPRVH
jgi:hypothetical protein